MARGSNLLLSVSENGQWNTVMLISMTPFTLQQQSGVVQTETEYPKKPRNTYSLGFSKKKVSLTSDLKNMQQGPAFSHSWLSNCTWCWHPILEWQFESWWLHFWSRSLPVQFGRAADDGPRTWAPATHIGGPDEVPSSWLQIGLALAVFGILEVKRWMEGFHLCLFLSLSLCCSAF